MLMGGCGTMRTDLSAVRYGICWRQRNAHRTAVSREVLQPREDDTRDTGNYAVCLP